jgi:hypothetical protein
MSNIASSATSAEPAVSPVHEQEESDNTGEDQLSPSPSEEELLKEKRAELKAALEERKNAVLKNAARKELKNLSAKIETIEEHIEILEDNIKRRRITLDEEPEEELRTGDFSERELELLRRTSTSARSSRGGMNSTFMSTGEMSYKIPSNLPKFRGNAGVEDPQEFLDQLGRICRANGVAESRFSTILPVCLDSVDGRWFEAWMKEHQEHTWKDAEKAFIAHFQNPNATAIWMSEIRALKMGRNGVQRYADQFVRLAEKMKWSMTDESVIYQFKLGLEPWLVEQLSIAESNHLLSLETSAVTNAQPISIQMLTKLALRIEANRAIHNQQQSFSWKERWILSKKRTHYHRVP